MGFETPPHLCSCLSCTWLQRKGPNSICSERYASKGIERENRQQQQPLFLSMKPSFIPCSLQAVRGALQLTVSVHKQKTQMNKLSAFCQQVRRTGRAKSRKSMDKREKLGDTSLNIFPKCIPNNSELHKKRRVWPEPVK